MVISWWCRLMIRGWCRMMIRWWCWMIIRWWCWMLVRIGCRLRVVMWRIVTVVTSWWFVRNMNFVWIVDLIIMIWGRRRWCYIIWIMMWSWIRDTQWLSQIWIIHLSQLWFIIVAGLVMVVVVMLVWIRVTVVIILWFLSFLWISKLWSVIRLVTVENVWNSFPDKVIIIVMLIFLMIWRIVWLMVLIIITSVSISVAVARILIIIVHPWIIVIIVIMMRCDAWLVSCQIFVKLPS